MLKKRQHSTEVGVIQEEKEEEDDEDNDGRLNNNHPGGRSGEDDGSSDDSSDDGAIRTIDKWSQEVSVMQDEELMRAFILPAPRIVPKLGF